MVLKNWKKSHNEFGKTTWSFPVLSREPQVLQGFWNNWEQRFFDSEFFSQTTACHMQFSDSEML
jgi:hypothetical protein